MKIILILFMLMYQNLVSATELYNLSADLPRSFQKMSEDKKIKAVESAFKAKKYKLIRSRARSRFIKYSLVTAAVSLGTYKTTEYLYRLISSKVDPVKFEEELLHNLGQEENIVRISEANEIDLIQTLETWERIHVRVATNNHNMVILQGVNSEDGMVEKGSEMPESAEKNVILLSKAAYKKLKFHPVYAENKDKFNILCNSVVTRTNKELVARYISWNNAYRGITESDGSELISAANQMLIDHGSIPADQKFSAEWFNQRLQKLDLNHIFKRTSNGAVLKTSLEQLSADERHSLSFVFKAKTNEMYDIFREYFEQNDVIPFTHDLPQSYLQKVSGHYSLIGGTALLITAYREGICSLITAAISIVTLIERVFSQHLGNAINVAKRTPSILKNSLAQYKSDFDVGFRGHHPYQLQDSYEIAYLTKKYVYGISDDLQRSIEDHLLSYSINYAVEDIAFVSAALKLPNTFKQPNSILPDFEQFFTDYPSQVRKSLIRFIRRSYAQNNDLKRLTIYLWGPPGTGKTRAAQMIAKSLNLRFTSALLDGQDPSGAIGTKEPGKLFQSLEVAKDIADPVAQNDLILFMDEFDRATRNPQLNSLMLKVLDPDVREVKSPYYSANIHLPQITILAGNSPITDLAMENRLISVYFGGFEAEQKRAIVHKSFIPDILEAYSHLVPEDYTPNQELLDQVEEIIQEHTSPGIRDLRQQIQMLIEDKVLGWDSIEKEPAAA